MRPLYCLAFTNGQCGLPVKQDSGATIYNILDTVDLGLPVCVYSASPMGGYKSPPLSPLGGAGGL